jgi:hypothetical protein
MMRTVARATATAARTFGLFAAALLSVQAIGATRTLAAQIPPAAAPATQKIPDRFTDQEFWKFINDVSEPGGYFRSDNILSNETGFQYVIPSLLRAPREGKVYLGVGPEQNYTYIAALKPKIAIIFDIRRGNLHEHMLYKALFELSPDRAEFMSRLFSKPRPAGLDTTVSADSLFEAYWWIPTDSALYRKNRDAVRDLLVTKHGWSPLSAEMNDIYYVYDQFYYWGPSITYNLGQGAGRGGGMPTYREIMTATDGAGKNRAYLATEANWRFIKDMHARNMIVPVVGDFGGPKAIRAVGDWLKERGGVVTAFYASNVEQYLFQDGKAWAYYDNVASLPVDSNSVFIRSAGGGARGFVGGGGMRGPNLLCSIPQLLAAHKAGQTGSYAGVLALCSY